MLTPADLVNPKRGSGYNHVVSAGGKGSGHGGGKPWCAVFDRRDDPIKGKSGAKGKSGPRRATALEAAQDYCNHYNGNPSVAATPTLKSAGHTYIKPKRVMDDEERAAWGVIKDRQAQRAGVQGYVYCIGDGEYVKIGYSVNPQKRVVELQTGNARPLALLATLKGTEADERKLHRKHGKDNELQEWFRPTDAVLSSFGLKKGAV